jgi:hypothetical protein
VFDGTRDESIDEEDQIWAMSKLEEFSYRKIFHLSKRQMAEEPLEDVVINLKLAQLTNRKTQMDMSEHRTRSGG